MANSEDELTPNSTNQIKVRGETGADRWKLSPQNIFKFIFSKSQKILSLPQNVVRRTRSQPITKEEFNLPLPITEVVNKTDNETDTTTTGPGERENLIFDEEDVVFMREISANMVCRICHMLFIDCAMLSCGHFFCHYCANCWTHHFSHCPICRKNVKLYAKRVYSIDQFISESYPLLLTYFNEEELSEEALALMYPPPISRNKVSKFNLEKQLGIFGIKFPSLKRRKEILTERRATIKEEDKKESAKLKDVKKERSLIDNICELSAYEEMHIWVRGIQFIIYFLIMQISLGFIDIYQIDSMRNVIFSFYCTILFNQVALAYIESSMELNNFFQENFAGLFLFRRFQGDSNNNSNTNSSTSTAFTTTSSSEISDPTDRTDNDLTTEDDEDDGRFPINNLSEFLTNSVEFSSDRISEWFRNQRRESSNSDIEIEDDLSDFY